MPATPCKGCGSTTRKTPHPGPRCATCHRQVVKERRSSAHGRRLELTYGITADEYAALLALQGGACAICQRATGRTRRLAVDHDHAQALADGHDEAKGCPNCVRGLLCKPCNRLLGHVRDDPETLRRAARYLEEPPNDRAHRRAA